MLAAAVAAAAAAGNPCRKCDHGNRTAKHQLDHLCGQSVCVCVSVTRWNMSLSATQRTRKKCVRVSVVSIAVFQVSSTNHAAATCRKPSNMVLNFLVVAMMGMSCAQQLFSNRPVKPACPWAAHLGAGGRRKPASCVQDSTNTKEGATSDSQGT